MTGRKKMKRNKLKKGYAKSREYLIKLKSICRRHNLFVDKQKVEFAPEGQPIYKYHLNNGVVCIYKFLTPIQLYKIILLG
jgi:hypothetical protein